MLIFMLVILLFHMDVTDSVSTSRCKGDDPHLFLRICVKELKGRRSGVVTRSVNST